MTARRLLTAIAGSATAVAAITGLVYALRPVAPTLSLGVLYTLAVLLASIFFGLGFATATAFASMAAFNFLFLPPVHTLTLADHRDWAALAVYLVTAVVASELATRARRRAAEAEQRELEAALLSDAAAALLQESPLDEIQSRADVVLAGADPVARHRFDTAIDALLAAADDRRDAEVVRRSDAIKTIVLQTVSHDFRTPLATMQAAVGGLEDASLELTDADRDGLIETMRIETARLARLVENVLDLSRLQAGAAAPHAELWSVDDLIAQAVAEVSEPARVRVDAPSGLPAVLVDATQMQRVLVNLIENAVKFSDGEIEVTGRDDGERVAIDVSDRGGRDPVAREGLRLGLSIAQGFTAVNGGTLTLAAREGRGTCAALRLPAQRIPSGVAR